MVTGVTAGTGKITANGEVAFRDHTGEASMQRPILLTLASAAAFGLMALAPAAAADLERAPQRIAFAELDLNDQAGARTMLGRIEFAANSACGERAGPMTLAERGAIRSCVRQKTERAVSDVNNVNLTALYYQRRPNISVAS